MNNTLLKIFVLGGVGYLIYKYYYLPSQSPKTEYPSIEPIEDDGRSIFYGSSKSDYVRGFSFPPKITDIEFNQIDVITKPDETIFDLPPRTMFRVNLNKDTNRIIYFVNTDSQIKEFIADYDKVKDKIVMSKNYTKSESDE
jgi:hypothetical protein